MPTIKTAWYICYFISYFHTHSAILETYTNCTFLLKLKKKSIILKALIHTHYCGTWYPSLRRQQGFALHSAFACDGTGLFSRNGLGTMTPSMVFCTKTKGPLQSHQGKGRNCSVKDQDACQKLELHEKKSWSDTRKLRSQGLAW